MSPFRRISQEEKWRTKAVVSTSSTTVRRMFVLRKSQRYGALCKCSLNDKLGGFGDTDSVVVSKATFHDVSIVFMSDTPTNLPDIYCQLICVSIRIALLKRAAQ